VFRFVVCVASIHLLTRVVLVATGWWSDMYSFGKLAMLLLTGSVSHPFVVALREHNSLDGVPWFTSRAARVACLTPAWLALVELLEHACCADINTRRQSSYVSIWVGLEAAVAESVPPACLRTVVDSAVAAPAARRVAHRPVKVVTKAAAVPSRPFLPFGVGPVQPQQRGDVAPSKRALAMLEGASSMALQGGAVPVVQGQAKKKRKLLAGI
jgi:hypothetical protein